MLSVYICVGSSCHLKGSYQIMKIFQEIIKEKNLEEKVELKASFCLGNCINGVSIKVNDEIFGDLKSENAREKFDEYILKKVNSND
ncbi:NAD(P)H-dependent oxidoreductase subunit E [Caloramator sp. CAR-1]|uniref:(2Fe-2S) ferredoxin domain-containing protein n=1 Tax=Caloramator sp. CAR-1 TaxID=3062777 RepID=UPI0026E3910B|nr:NAD(P)H-dependent oxidoreductase subunit E [Caloramator sp. CAR-1]MDO6354682.1 NAD(P)H-dependent oxidoreductase subunit E [Caloramator sp. CAR-1]